MLPQNVVGVLSLLTAPAPPVGDVSATGYARLYESYIASYESCRADRVRCVEALGVATGVAAGKVGALGVGVAETLYSWVPDVEGVAGAMGGAGVAVGSAVGAAGAAVERGANYVRNKRRRDARKRGGAACTMPGVAGSATTGTVEVAEELEARRTLAVRRVEENKVAARLAELRLVGLNDASKTDALEKLQAARIAQRVNEATAKSEASYKKCDASLKSLGSVGSAGEFALKQEVKELHDLRVRHKYLEAQFGKAYEHLSPAVRQEIAEMPEPVGQSAWDVFGTCPSDYGEDEQTAYYSALDQADRLMCGIGA